MASLGAAQRLHAGQVDKGGVPYWTHLHRVALLLLNRWPDAPRVQVVAALFHDVLEDVKRGEQHLRAEGVSDECIAIVRALTRPPDISYQGWIHRLAHSGDQGVLRIKWADLTDNLNPLRPNYPGRVGKNEGRYEPALVTVESALTAETQEVTHGR